MATKTIQDAYTQVYLALRDVGDVEDSQLLTQTEITAVITEASVRYSADRPREVAEDLEADGTTTLALPDGWADEFSRLISLEHPIGEEPPNVRDSREWTWYRTPDGQTIRWLNGVPGNGDTVRAMYTAQRAFAALAADTTVPDTDFYAVCDLSVSIGCDWIANKFAQTSDAVLSADAVNYRSKAQEWTDRAKRFAVRYREQIGVPEAGPSSVASGWANWDTTMTNGRDFMWHRRALR